MGFNINETEDRLNFNNKRDNQEDTLPLMLLISNRAMGDYPPGDEGGINFRIT